MLEKLLESQREFFKSGTTLDINFRLKALKKLRNCITKFDKDIKLALKKDLNKSEFESFVSETGFVLKELNFVINNLKEWVKPKKVKTDLVNYPAKSYIYRQPFGVTLILSPWNYPFHLAIMPLIGAIAAGNTAIVKPSEFSVNTSKVLNKMISKCFDEKFIAVVEGDKNVAESLLNLKFDKIFYTGNTQVGKVVMKKAAEHLTPVTLELGGKSPAIVLKDAKIDLAAKRIVWGKFLNAGQTCVAVDYVACEKSIHKKLTKAIIKHTKKLVKSKGFKQNFSRIINERHYNRLIDLIDESKIIFSVGFEPDKLKIYPVIVKTSVTDKIMEDEIFGPILPIIEFDNYEQIRRFILSKPKPLALYIFTESNKNKEMVLNDIQSGGVTINDTIVHLSSSRLPFGGIGESGFGSYHGIFSFYEFSQARAVMDRSTAIDFPVRYQPYTSMKLALVKRIFK